MFGLKFFRRRKSVVERIGAYTFRVPGPITPATRIDSITLNIPATVDGALLAHQFERELKRRGLT